MKLAKPEALILHPRAYQPRQWKYLLPRSLADGPAVRRFSSRFTNGVATRMAILYLLMVGRLGRACIRLLK